MPTPIPVADPAACTTTTTTAVTLPMRCIVLTSDGERCFMKVTSVKVPYVEVNEYSVVVVGILIMSTDG
jgi:hypothetical protein